MIDSGKIILEPNQGIYITKLCMGPVKMSAFFIINFGPEISLILLIFDIYPGKSRKMSLNILECPGF